MVDTKTISTEDRRALGAAARILEAGGLVAFPTDTVYGLGASAFDGRAVERLSKAKRRPPDKPIPVLLADFYALEQVVQNPSRQVRLLAEAFWPGPLTIVWSKVPSLPKAVSSKKTVGVRVPDHDFARELLRRVGPLAVSSANHSGAATTRTAREVLAQLSGRIHLVIDGGLSSGRQPSTVVRFEGDEFKILRQGPIGAEEIQRALG
jgi:L-threonylcarbamoyladenylate synthase